MHFGYVFLFVLLFVLGCALFYNRFKSATNDQQLLMKAHLALSLVLRTENHLNGCIDSRKFREMLKSKARGEEVDKLYRMRPGYLAKWIEI